MLNLNQDPGEGNLSVRAYVAATVGPLRIAHGNRQIRQIQTGEARELAKNGSADKQVMYVEVWPPMQLRATGVWVLFSSSEQTGETGRLVLLTGVPGQIQERFQALLLPNDQLYGQAVRDGAGNPIQGNVPLVVSKVTF